VLGFEPMTYGSESENATHYTAAPQSNRVAESKKHRNYNRWIWLVVSTALQHRKVNLCQLRGGKLAQLAKDGQRDTMHITLRYTIIM